MPRGGAVIVLWGSPRDTPLAMVDNELRGRGAQVQLLDQERALETELDVWIDGGVRGAIRIGLEQWDLDAITAVYPRPYDPRSLPGVSEAGQGSAAWGHAFALHDGLSAWLELTDALVVNRACAMALNNCKPLQAIQIRSFGFETPDTLITTDPDAAKAFWTEHGAVIYKSISGVRSIVARLTETHLERMDDLAWCPTQFQQYVPGHDYRVHVVGEQIFACRIRCEADDYRYASRQDLPVVIEACELPTECAEQCRLLASGMDLLLAGVDLRLTPDGRWFCFEVNPSPAFSYYQNATGQPIAAAVAHLLMQGNAVPAPRSRARRAVAHVYGSEYSMDARASRLRNTGLS